MTWLLRPGWCWSLGQQRVGHALGRFDPHVQISTPSAGSGAAGAEQPFHRARIAGGDPQRAGLASFASAGSCLADISHRSATASNATSAAASRSQDFVLDGLGNDLRIGTVTVQDASGVMS